MHAVDTCYKWIGRWGKDTIDVFKGCVRTNNGVDYICIASLSVCSTYSNAIASLLAQELRMPAKALLRCLFEVSVKVLWCLHEPGKETSDAAIEERIKRWAKSAIKARLKLRRGLGELLTSGPLQNENQSICDRMERDLSQLVYNDIPNVKDITKALGESWQSFYTRLYLPFNDAVHLDFVSLCENATDDGHTIDVQPDSDEPIGELAKFWVLDIHMLLFAVRSHYGWDTEAMDSEFKAIDF